MMWRLSVVVELEPSETNAVTDFVYSFFVVVVVEAAAQDRSGMELGLF